MSIQRWTIVGSGFAGVWSQGEWVRYDDHVAALAEAAKPRTLTADDPEPAVGSVVLDRDGAAWQRSHTAWLTGDDLPADWADLTTDFGPLRLIHDGGQA